MRKSKLYSLVAALLIATLVLTGCGSSSSDKKESSASDNKTESSASIAPESNKESKTEATTEKITVVAATGAVPKPYIFVDENDELTGYDTEVLKAVFALLPQYDLQLEVTDFTSIFAGLTAGKYQIGFNSFTYNEERAQSYLYSFPYDLNAYVFVQKEGETPITSFAEAAGKTIEGGASGAITTGIEKWNEDNADKAINLQYTEADTTTVLQHVADGVVDFAIMDPAMYKVYTEEFDFGALQATALDEESTLFISSNLNAYFLLPLESESLRKDINEAIKVLHDNGTLAELTTKWFGRELVPNDDQYVSTLN